MNTTQEIDKRISIANQELSIAKSLEERERLQKKIQKLRLEKDIATIRFKIQQLSS